MIKKINYIDLIEKLGAGGTASVYLGVDNHSGFPVAATSPANHSLLASQEQGRLGDYG